jgi:hypothetical protein
MQQIIDFALEVRAGLAVVGCNALEVLCHVNWWIGLRIRTVRIETVASRTKQLNDAVSSLLHKLSGRYSQVVCGR